MSPSYLSPNPYNATNSPSSPRYAQSPTYGGYASAIYGQKYNSPTYQASPIYAPGSDGLVSPGKIGSPAVARAGYM